MIFFHKSYPSKLVSHQYQSRNTCHNYCSVTFCRLCRVPVTDQSGIGKSNSLCIPFEFANFWLYKDGQNLVKTSQWRSSNLRRRVLTNFILRFVNYFVNSFSATWPKPTNCSSGIDWKLANPSKLSTMTLEKFSCREMSGSKSSQRRWKLTRNRLPWKLIKKPLWRSNQKLLHHRAKLSTNQLARTSNVNVDSIFKPILPPRKSLNRHYENFGFLLLYCNIDV